MEINAEAQAVIDRLAALNYDEPHFNLAKVTAAMQKQYKLLNLEMPAVELATDMVMGYQIARDAARDAASGAAWDAAWDAAWGAARGAAWGAAWGAARGAAWGAARGAASDAAWGAAWGAASDAAWGAAALNTGLKDEPTIKWVQIATCELEALEAGLGFFFPMKDKLILVPTPRMVIANGTLHYDQGMAVEWPSGAGFYFLHGVQFKKDLYDKIVEQDITAEEVMQIQPIENRMAAIAMLKPAELLKQMEAKLIHTGIKGTKLFEVKNFMDTGDTEYCMLMVCPSTGRQYIEWTPPEVGKQGDADVCQAAALGVPVEDYLNNMVEA